MRTSDFSNWQSGNASTGGWPVGTYHVVVTLNGVTAGTKDFEVK
ncbi:MAG TPA: hypothetical protein VGQ48_02010 [Gemmatimonadales bacterium]|jgi:hypothetical protein|nr:hypothetical protein [Gemmatimonadales bacterium]